MENNLKSWTFDLNRLWSTHTSCTKDAYNLRMTCLISDQDKLYFKLTDIH